MRDPYYNCRFLIRQFPVEFHYIYITQFFIPLHTFIYIRTMTVNLRNFHKTNNPTSLINDPNFLSKNKITVNKPQQTHFTVEGVQSYAPEEIKAMKLRQMRTQQNKQGVFLPLRTVLLSDEIIEWPESELNKKSDPNNRKQKNRPQSAKQPKFHKMKEPTDEPLQQYLKKRKQQRINKKNAVSTNNQAIVKIEKTVAKKQALNYKLQKMKKMYKEYFKDTELLEKNVQGVQEVSEPMKEVDQILGNKKNTKQLAKNRPSTTNHQTDKQKQFDEQLSENVSFDDDDQSIHSQQNTKNPANPLNFGFDLINNCTSYSEKLGTAIHSMFN